MADSTILNLTAVTTPVSTDEFGCRQSGDTRDKKQTRAQLHTLESGEHLILPQVNEPATPTLGFGDGDTGFLEAADDQLSVSVVGSLRWNFITDSLQGNAVGSARLRNIATTATAPTIIPSRIDFDTGIGSGGADQLSLIAGALDCINISEVASARQIGFYVTAPVALQTGVAVTAAGLHAALVNLGLITA